MLNINLVPWLTEYPVGHGLRQELKRSQFIWKQLTPQITSITIKEFPSNDIEDHYEKRKRNLKKSITYFFIMTANWIPCLLGNKPQKTFIIPFTLLV